MPIPPHDPARDDTIDDLRAENERLRAQLTLALDQLFAIRAIATMGDRR